MNTGAPQDANGLPVPKENADLAMDAASCIGCGACVAACPNAAAMLFVGAKISHLGLLPQGAPERRRRVLAMVEQMDRDGFGNCGNIYECEAACPKSISVENIAHLNREYIVASASAPRSSASATELRRRSKARCGTWAGFGSRSCAFSAGTLGEVVVSA